jgi:thiol-disulfide isomerase/thioredoxin
VGDAGVHAEATGTVLSCLSGSLDSLALFPFPFSLSSPSMRSICLALLCCLALMATVVSAGAGLYGPKEAVVELTASNFQKEVIQSADVWLVEFYAPWCGHCKSLAPEWVKAANALNGVVKVGAVNMDEHQSVGGPYGIQGFPVSAEQCEAQSRGTVVLSLTSNVRFHFLSTSDYQSVWR